jgi:hypothetical protein
VKGFVSSSTLSGLVICTSEDLFYLISRATTIIVIFPFGLYVTSVKQGSTRKKEMISAARPDICSSWNHDILKILDDLWDLKAFFWFKF